MEINEQDIRKFYRFLDHKEETNIRIPTNNEQKDFFVHNEDEFVMVCKKFNGKHNIYVGVNERITGGNDAQAVKSLNAVYVDIDFERYKNTASTENEVNETLEIGENIRNDLREYGLAMKTMSGNGCQLFWKSEEIEINESNRESIKSLLKRFERYLQQTYQKPNIKIDPVTADLARIMKVSGTMSVKGENTVERPHRLSKILADGDKPTKIMDFIKTLPEEGIEKSIIIGTGWKDIDDDKIMEIFKNDKKLRDCFDGKWQQYPEMNDRKRDGVEQFVIQKLLEKKVPFKQIKEIMKGCKVGKYQEKIASGYGDSYLENIIKYAQLSTQKIKKVKEMEESEKQVDNKWKNNIKNFITKYIDALDMAEQLYNIQPFFYDKSKIIWMWNMERCCWGMVDETDVLNSIMDAMEHRPDITRSKTKNEFLEAIKQLGRRKTPTPIDRTWIQFNKIIVDIKTDKVYESTPEYFCTNPIPWNVGESEDTPNMDRIFKEWVGIKHIETLYEIIAYCMLPDYPIARIFCLNGSGCNGKTKYISLIRRFLGEENCCSTDLDTLMNSRFEQARLYKKLMCEMGETNFAAMRKTERLKKLVGGDFIGFEFKNKDPFNDNNYAKVIISTNQLPITFDKTKGFYRRWFIIDFPNEFTEKKDILDDIPIGEYNNLAKKCLRILSELLKKKGFTGEGSIEDREMKYEEISNPVRLFITKECVESVDDYIPFGDFYKRLLEFLRLRGKRKMTAKEVGKVLQEEGFESKIQNIKREDGSKTTIRALFGINWLAETKIDEIEENTEKSLETFYNKKVVNNTGITGITGNPIYSLPVGLSGNTCNTCNTCNTMSNDTGIAPPSCIGNLTNEYKKDTRYKKDTYSGYNNKSQSIISLNEKLQKLIECPKKPRSKEWLMGVLDFTEEELAKLQTEGILFEPCPNMLQLV